MRYFILAIFILFFSACSPKYKITKEYIAPKANQKSSLCLGLCENKKTLCQTKCKEKFNTCKIKADKIAQKRYEKKKKTYLKELEAYVNRVEDYNLDLDLNFAYIGPIGYPYYDDPFFRSRYFMSRAFWYEPRYHYIGAKPKKPSLQEEKLKAQSQMCELDCGCQDKFESCFISCGGSIVEKKVCIQNCPND